MYSDVPQQLSKQEKVPAFLEMLAKFTNIFLANK